MGFYDFLDSLTHSLQHINEGEPSKSSENYSQSIMILNTSTGLGGGGTLLHISALYLKKKKKSSSFVIQYIIYTYIHK